MYGLPFRPRPSDLREIGDSGCKFVVDQLAIGFRGKQYTVLVMVGLIGVGFVREQLTGATPPH